MNRPQAPWTVRAFAFLAQRLVTGLVVVGMTMLSPGVRPFVVAQAQTERASDTLDGFGEFMEHLAELRDAIDRTQFDVDALSFELAFESPDTIVNWVDVNIAFEPYVGLLRGPTGTLMSRAGNALDQAVLLARLLVDAGYEARVLRGELPRDDARRLVEQVREPRADRPPLGDLDAIRESVSTLGNVLGTDVTELLAVFDASPSEFGPENSVDYAEANDVTARILTDLSTGEEELGDAGGVERLIDEARDYFWVEYRTSPDDEWVRAHPAVAEPDGSFREIVAIESFEGSIPESLQHRLRFEVTITQHLGEDEEVHTVMPGWERPVANLVGMPITYTNVADSIGPDAFDDIRGALVDATLFGPSFNFGLAPDGQFFDLSGNVVDPAAAASPAAGLFSNLGDRLGNAAGTVAGAEDPDSFVTLAKQTLVYTLISPGGAERTFERDIMDVARYDEVGEDLRVAMARDLSQTFTFMVDVGAYAPGFILDAYLSRVVAMRPALEYFFLQQRFPDRTVPRPAEDALPNAPWLGFLGLFTTFDAPAAEEESRVSYRPSPTLVVHNEDIFGFDTVREGIDVIANDRRTLSFGEDRLALDPGRNVFRGVWETLQEGTVLPADESSQVSTRAVFDAADAEGIGTRVIEPGDAYMVDELDIPGEAAESLRRDLSRGYTVIVPEAVPETLGRTGWWRVDRRTGVTLGVDDRGLGAQQVEYIIALSIVVGKTTAIACFAFKIGGSDSTIKTISDCGKLGVVAGGVVIAGAAYGGIAVAASKGSALALAVLYFALEAAGNF